MVLDTGQFLCYGSRTTKIKADYMARGMAVLGYDAVNIAGWDFFLGEKFLRELKDKYRLPFVSANIRYKETGAYFAKPYVVKRYGGGTFLGIGYGGIRLGIFGIASPEGIKRIKPQEGDRPLMVDEPLETVRQVLKKLKGRSDLVIMLTDLEVSQSQELAKKVEGIDLVIGGRTGSVEKEPKKVGETYLAVAGTKGYYAGDLVLSLGPERGLESIESHSQFLDEKIEDDQRILELIQELKERQKGLRPKKIRGSKP